LLGKARRSLHARVGVYVGATVVIAPVVAAVAVAVAERGAPDANLHVGHGRLHDERFDPKPAG
jgi:hypothetical protein